MAFRRRSSGGLIRGLMRRFIWPVIAVSILIVAFVWALNAMNVWDKTVDVIARFLGVEAAETADRFGDEVAQTGDEIIDDPRSILDQILNGEPPVTIPDIPLPDGGGDAPFLPDDLPAVAPGDDTDIDWAHVTAQLDSLGTTNTTAGQRIEPYDRDKHFGDWIDHDDDGCRDDEEVRLRDSTDVTLKEGSACAPQTGTLHDPYSGKTITYDRDDQPLAVEVEHIVSLHDIYYSGGWQMTYDERVAIAHDLERELVLSSRDENQAKKEKTPYEWMPSDPAAWCWYASAYIEVKATYDLTVDDDNRAFLGDVIAACSG